MKRIDDWATARSFWTILLIGWVFGTLLALIAVIPVALFVGQPAGALIGFTLGMVLAVAGEAFALERWG